MTAIDFIYNLKIPNLTIINYTIFVNNSAVDYFISDKEPVEHYMRRTYNYINTLKKEKSNSQYVTEYLEYTSYLPIERFIRKQKLEKINKVNE